MKHKKAKLTLRVLGIILIIIGLGLSITGFANFIMAFGEGFPDLFWMMMVGSPLLFVGIVLTVLGFHKEITTYVSNETKGVTKDYLASVKDGIVKPTSETKTCPNCGHVNDINDAFCSECGKPFASLNCPKCGKSVNFDDKYCPNCGQKLNKLTKHFMN